MLRAQPLDTARHKVGYAPDLVPTQFGPRPQKDDDRGRRLLLIFGEQSLLRKHKVHPGLLDFQHPLDGPGKFPFQRSLVIDLLDELGHPYVRLIKQLVAHSPHPGNSLTCKLHPQLIDVLRGDQNSSPPP